MAQPWVTGPAHLFLGLGAFSSTIGQATAGDAAGPADQGASSHYLGTAERSPRITIVPKYIPVYVSALSRVIAGDSAFAGEEAFIFADLTRWNESVYQLAANRPLHAGGKLGTWEVDDLGVLTNSQPTLQLQVLFPYSGKGAYTGMPAGYSFPQVESMGPDDFYSLGINPRKTRVGFHALPKLVGKTWTLYTIL